MKCITLWQVNTINGFVKYSEDFYWSYDLNEGLKNINKIIKNDGLEIVNQNIELIETYKGELTQIQLMVDKVKKMKTPKTEAEALK